MNWKWVAAIIIIVLIAAAVLLTAKDSDSDGFTPVIPGPLQIEAHWTVTTIFTDSSIPPKIVEEPSHVIEAYLAGLKYALLSTVGEGGNEVAEINFKYTLNFNQPVEVYSETVSATVTGESGDAVRIIHIGVLPSEHVYPYSTESLSFSCAVTAEDIENVFPPSGEGVDRPVDLQIILAMDVSFKYEGSNYIIHSQSGKLRCHVTVKGVSPEDFQVIYNGEINPAMTVETLAELTEVGQIYVDENGVAWTLKQIEGTSDTYITVWANYETLQAAQTKETADMLYRTMIKLNPEFQNYAIQQGFTGDKLDEFCMDQITYYAVTSSYEGQAYVYVAGPWGIYKVPKA